MKRKLIDSKTGPDYFESARFLQHLPIETRKSLDVDQKRAIVSTILDLQKNNPRILREIYLEYPDEDNPQRPGIFKRIYRRADLLIRSFIYEFILQKNERRFAASFADYIFLLMMIGILFAIAIVLIMVLYSFKNLIGVDIFPGVHFFYVE